MKFPVSCKTLNQCVCFLRFPLVNLSCYWGFGCEPRMVRKRYFFLPYDGKFCYVYFTHPHTKNVMVQSHLLMGNRPRERRNAAKFVSYSATRLKPDSVVGRVLRSSHAGPLSQAGLRSARPHVQPRESKKESKAEGATFPGRGEMEEAPLSEVLVRRAHRPRSFWVGCYIFTKRVF